MRHQHRQAKAASKQQGANVLIVDDDAQVVRMIRLVLESHGYSCITAFGGAQALSQFAHSDHVDVIVTDLSMAWGDGASFIQTIRRHSQIPVFVITGRVKEFATRMCAMDNVVVLPKPLDTHELVKRIRTACRHRKLAPAPGDTN